MDEQNPNIIERIHAAYYQLTAAERKVADFVLAQYDHVQYMSITQLADECGTAEATISRFCRTLKLKGFNAFKLELAQHAAASQATAFGDGVAADTKTLEGRCRETVRLAQEAVSQTVELVHSKDLLKTVELFEQAGQQQPSSWVSDSVCTLMAKAPNGDLLPLLSGATKSMSDSPLSCLMNGMDTVLPAASKQMLSLTACPMKNLAEIMILKFPVSSSSSASLLSCMSSIASGTALPYRTPQMA